MPSFECGYLITLAKVRAFIPKTREEEEDTNALALLYDIDKWWFQLPCEVQRKTPLPRIYLPPGCDDYNY
ncbi:hypothetical protein M413DRAFT_447998 [Hebeloma cylindrosporum]|uniref:Uncharacterized protein n=1 Tax=Hebeloma cylindrosporum TaxID=76867 RepID=A0A0C3C1X0_HEBCY|nr:hypothetical protein M413DRAFT_447998 [Hebeloma cylindrosporum h7]